MSWPIVTLNDIAINIVDGPFGSSLKTSDYVDEGVPVLQGKNITGNRFKFFDVRYITEKKAESIKRSTVKVGDHLLVKIGSIGYSAIIDDLYGHDFAIIPANLAKITPNKEVIDSRYLHRYLTSDSAIRYFQKIASKTAQPALSLSKIKALEIPLPPLAEQRRIASILDQADELRQKRQQAIEKLDQLLQATFIDMFGDPVSNPKGWEKDELQNICKQVIDCPHSTPTWSDKGIICLRTSNLGKGEWIWEDTRYVSSEEYKERTKRSEIFEGDIILSREGTVGIAVIVPNDLKLSLGQRLVQLTPRLDRINSEFLLQVLLYDLDPIRISSLMVGSTSKHINVKDLRALKVFVPPLELQRKFSLIALQISQQKIELKSSLSNVDNLFKSLQNQAFNGTL